MLGGDEHPATCSSPRDAAQTLQQRSNDLLPVGPSTRADLTTPGINGTGATPADPSASFRVDADSLIGPLRLIRAT